MTDKRRRSQGEGSVFPYKDGYAAILDLGWICCATFGVSMKVSLPVSVGGVR